MGHGQRAGARGCGPSHGHRDPVLRPGARRPRAGVAAPQRTEEGRRRRRPGGRRQEEPLMFPQEPLGTKVEFQIGGTWVDVTEHAQLKNIITHQRGRTGEGQAVDPASCSLTVRSPDGLYSPRNPRSPYYGLLQKNTPMRVSVAAGDPFLDLPGAADVASTPDAAALDITGDIDLRWEGECDWYANGAQMLIAKWGAAGNRSYNMRVQDGGLYIHTTQDGTVGRQHQLPLPSGLPRHAAVRTVMDVDNGAGGMTSRHYWAETLDGPWTQIGEDLASSGTITIWSSTAALSIAPEQLDLVTPVRLPVVGRCYRAEVRAGIDGTVVASPDFTAQTPGATSFVDGAGRTWTMASADAITDRRILFSGEYSDWPPRWDRAGKLITIEGEGAGILRRLNQGKKLLQSTLRRRIPSYSPVAYWPMEEGADATSVSSPIPGVRPFTPTELKFAADDTLPGSDPLPIVQVGASFIAQVPAAADGTWQVEMVYRLDEMPVAETTLLEVGATGTVRRLQLRVATNQVWLVGLDSDGATLFTETSTAPGFAGSWNRVQLLAIESGSDVTYRLQWIIIGENSFQISSTQTAVPGHVVSIRSSFGTGLDGMSFGHLSVFADQVTAYNYADHGFNEETAGERLVRLGAEEGVPITVIGGPADTALMGPQRPATLLEQLEQCAQADDGMLVEDRERLGLVYRPRTSLYNQEPALTLSYRQRGLAALEPIDDDSNLRNDVTVERTGGSSGRAELTTGPLSVEDPPNGVGRYDDSVTLNLASDDQTEPMARWLLHLGTVDEARYPVVSIRLHRAPELIPAVLALTEGDLVRLTDLPDWLPPGPVDLIVQGLSEEVGVRTWTVSLVCAPGSPWWVAVVGDETSVAEDFEDTTLAITITDGGDLPWTRTNTQAHAGAWSLRSGTITNNQTSDAIVTVPDGAESLSFWYRTSSEASGTGFEGDRLTVLVDGVQVLRAQGETPWTHTTVDVADAAAVTFRYAKDNSAASGEDAVYIDDVTFVVPAEDAPFRADTDGSELDSGVDEDDTTLVVAVTAGPVWVPSAVLPAEFPFDIRVGGEVMTVTAVSGTTSPQTFSVVRSVNGVVKPHEAGADVRLATPAIVAL
ncbi:hypothetical protein ABZ690_11950 [Streptomyces sp. NPDC006967]|uniref:hypothetical protein n=1 Tax=Streptomyces sp. NPDC006967 TaxID=3156906 RepID=UPI0034066C74